MKSKLHGIFAIVLSIAIIMSTLFSSILSVTATSDIGDYEGNEVNISGDDQPHEHNYVPVVTDPTCTEQGYTTHTCSICYDEYVDTYVNALGHTGGAATCHSKAVCTRCLQEYGEFDANNHDGETEIRNAKTATCTEKGYTGDTYCLGCGNRITSGSDISALGHDYNAVVTNPTCTERGYTTHTCSRCKDSYVDTYTEALGHTVGDWLSNANEHWHYCTECEQDVDKASHTSIGWIIDTDATYDTVGHRHKECIVCGYVMEEEDIPVINHEHNYVPVVTNPTCTEQGYTTHTCSICSSSYVDSFTDALGHTGGTATCHSKAVCTRCLQEYGEFDADNHDGETEIRNAIAATCTEKGYTGDTYCLSCGSRITSGSDISAPGHTVGDWLSNANEHWHYCTECEQDIDKAVHTASDWIIDADATAETAGHKHKECTVCGYVMEEEDIPVILTHIPGDINNDGKVNNKDLTRLFQYLSKWNVEVNAQALDVNGDGKINNKDLTRLFQYLSKWDVQIF